MKKIFRENPQSMECCAMTAVPEVLSHYVDTVGIVINNLCCELGTKQAMNI